MHKCDEGWKAELTVSITGTFEYFLQYGKEHSQRGTSGHWMMEPRIGMPLDQISLLTMVNKWMGKLNGWECLLRNAKESGYNMIHWTPLQTRGTSNSPFSIKDQLDFDPEMFSEGVRDCKREEIWCVKRLNGHTR